MATRRETIALNDARRSAPIASGENSRQRDRDRRHREDQRELQGFEQGIAAEDRRDSDDENQADRHQDEEIADPQHGALEMRNGLGLFDEMGGLAEIGVHACGRHQAGHFALFGDRARIGVVADLLVDRQRFSGQRRLIDGEIAPDQFQIGRDDVAELDQHDVARNQEFRLDVLPDAVAQDPRLQREALLEQRDGVVGLELLPEADASVDEQHRQNDREVGPMLQKSRQQGRDLDHPGDRPPEELDQTLQNADVMLNQRVLAVLREPPGRLRLAQPGGFGLRGGSRGNFCRRPGGNVVRAHRPAPQGIRLRFVAADIRRLPVRRHDDER